MRTQLKIFRVKQKLNQKQMAAKLGYERAYYGHVERGLQKGSTEFWTRLQTAYGLADDVIEELKKND